MYNKILDTFLTVAKCGSFTKASEHLYISSTAVKKQIDSLESQLGIILFNRSNQGITLTNAGVCLYEKTPDIIRLSAKILQEVQKASGTTVKLIRVGTSNIYPSSAFIEIWDRIGDHYPGFELSMVPISNDHDRLNLLDVDYDMLIGPYNSEADSPELSFIPIGDYRFCFAMPKRHLLSGRKSLGFNDLAGETLMIMKKGNSSINDRVRKDIENKYPDIKIQNIEPHYDYETFNQCVKSGNILLSLECWDSVHPSLVNIPMLADYHLPFGIVTSNSPSEDMTIFLKAIKDILRAK